MKIQHLLLLVIPVISSCSATVDTPAQVAEKYWQAIQQGDTTTAKKYISNNSENRLETQLNQFKTEKINDISITKDSISVVTTINPMAKATEKKKSFNTAMTFENNQWKVDLSNTHIPVAKISEDNLQKLAEKLSESMQKSVDSIEEVMGEGMNLLNDALREGSEEMGSTLLDTMQELNEKMNESIDKMKKERQKNPAAPESKDSESGEGLI